MTPIQLLLLSVSIFGLGALGALLFGASGRTARNLAGIAGLLGSLAGIAAGAAALLARPEGVVLFQIVPFGYFWLEMDALSAFLVCLISLVGVATSLYSLSSAPESAAVAFFTQVFMAAMLLVVTISNAFFFLFFWELMTLASYFLVIWQTDNEESIRTGYIYLLVAHAGAALIMLAFLLLFQQTGSFDFVAFRQAALSPAVRNLVFLLTFIGFGAKAGMVPLHFWTPGAYAAAPEHASALMAGVMKKLAVYGILRFSIDLLGAPAGWWALVLLFFGALSALFGAFYALTESHLKRLLAYSSVENVGLIFLGVGVGMFGVANDELVVATLGFLAALYHMLNHAFFKGLLFLGAGSAIAAAGTPDLNRMGGLSRRMPWTALTFLIGALAVAAIPPMSGFVSEWFLYQALFSSSSTSFFIAEVLGPLVVLLLAMVVALVAMVYTKAYGSAFSGPHRSREAAQAQDAPGAARLSMLYLALGCLLLGLGAPWIAPLISGVAAQMIAFSSSAVPLSVADGLFVYPVAIQQAVYSPPLVMILLLGLLSVPWLLMAALGGRRAGRRSGVDPWACGYGYSSSMSQSAGGFNQPVQATFGYLYRVRHLMDRPLRALAASGQTAVASIQRVEPVIEKAVTRPTIRLVESAGHWIQGMQMGDIRIYCMYIILTLAILLIVILGGSGL